MGQVSRLHIGLQTADNLVLAHNVVQPLRPVLLYPDLLFDITTPQLLVLAICISIFLPKSPLCNGTTKAKYRGATCMQIVFRRIASDL